MPLSAGGKAPRHLLPEKRFGRLIARQSAILSDASRTEFRDREHPSGRSGKSCPRPVSRANFLRDTGCDPEPRHLRVADLRAGRRRILRAPPIIDHGDSFICRGSGARSFSASLAAKIAARVSAAAYLICESRSVRPNFIHAGALAHW